MAQRPIFVPQITGTAFVQQIDVMFTWFSGFAVSQAQRSINSLHRAAAVAGIAPVLEISSKSADAQGVKLSAFNLGVPLKDGCDANVEAVFQGSKVFEHGGPFHDLYSAPGREAKTDRRIQNSGPLVGFNLLGERWPLLPRTAFYDWLYITALVNHQELADYVLTFEGFSDIAFNPEKSLNCQARSAALYVALHQRGVLAQTLATPEAFLQALLDADTLCVSMPETPTFVYLVS